MSPIPAVAGLGRTLKMWKDQSSPGSTLTGTAKGAPRRSTSSSRRSLAWHTTSAPSSTTGCGPCPPPPATGRTGEQLADDGCPANGPRAAMRPWLSPSRSPSWRPNVSAGRVNGGGTCPLIGEVQRPPQLLPRSSRVWAMGSASSEYPVSTCVMPSSGGTRKEGPDVEGDRLRAGHPCGQPDSIATGATITAATKIDRTDNSGFCRPP